MFLGIEIYREKGSEALQYNYIIIFPKTNLYNIKFVANSFL